MIDNAYIGIAVMSLIAIGFLVVVLFLARVFGPRYQTKTKELPFECGSVSVGSVRDQRFNVRYYLVAMLFILFDVEVIFMYPWAVKLRELGIAGLVEMLSFMVVLGIGLLYVWKRGALDWD